ncbi:hypothetical protein BLOT_001060 [Blomia tropicalis]|nr:hypothetical protein BLOT_001060 [Blomia tropicalis]
MQSQRYLEEWHFRKQVLRQFKCPFREQTIGCHHEAQPEECNFAHPNTRNLTAQPIGVPDYVCVYNLLNCCKLGFRKFPAIDGIFTICPTGFHLTTAEMLDLEYYEAKNCELIVKHYGEDSQHQCGICFERILSKRHVRERAFGLLDNCSHCFCAPCITKWRKEHANQSIVCPICRRSSNNVSITSKFVKNPLN